MRSVLAFLPLFAVSCVAADAAPPLGGGRAPACVVDDDTFATASATCPPSSESTKAYVDAEVAGAGGGGDVTGPCHSGAAVPVIADWTLDTAGTVTVMDTDHGISMLTTAAATTMIYTRPFADTSAEFGIWQDGNTRFQNVGTFVGLADADGTIGAGVWLRAGQWETGAINLTANTLTATGTTLATETQGPAYWRVRVHDSANVRIETGDNCGQWARAYNIAIDTTLLDVAVLGFKSLGAYLGTETNTARLFDYETE